MFFGPFLLKYFGSPYRWLLITRLPTQESSLSLLCAAQQVFCEKFQTQFWIEYSREHYKFLAIPFNSTKTSQPLASPLELVCGCLTPLAWEGRFFKTSAYPPLYHLFSHKPISTHWYLQFNQFDLGIKIVFRWFLKFCSSLSWSA